MGIINYQTLKPHAVNYIGGLPRLIAPVNGFNGITHGKTYQYQPSDHIDINTSKRNTAQYPEEELLYTVNEHNFRCQSFDKPRTKPILMTAGCSHTFGIGIRENEVWGKVLSKKLNYDLWNIGVGGIGADIVRMLIKQFFDNGYVPDLLAVLWPETTRKLLVIPGHADKTLDVDITQQIANGRPLPEPSVLLFNGGSFNLENLESFPEHVRNVVKDYLRTVESTHLIEFLKNRKEVIELCRARNVKIVEMFASDHPKQAFDLASGCSPETNIIIPQVKITLAQQGLGLDWDQARDGMHGGKRSNEIVADAFYDIIHGNDYES